MAQATNGASSKNENYENEISQGLQKKVGLTSKPQQLNNEVSPSSSKTSRSAASTPENPDQPRRRPNISAVTSRVGSLQNAHYKPKPSQVKVFNEKVKFERVGSRIDSGKKSSEGGSPEGQKGPPRPRGKSVDLNKGLGFDKTKVKSRIGSLANVNYKEKNSEATSEKKIFDDREYLRMVKKSKGVRSTCSSTSGD